MKKQNKKTSASHTPRVHESREDRSRTNAGKTANSKVRSEGRASAALERSALAQRASGAEKAKVLSTLT
jgi:hypothetical protein